MLGPAAPAPLLLASLFWRTWLCRKDPTKVSSKTRCTYKAEHKGTMDIRDTLLTVLVPAIWPPLGREPPCAPCWPFSIPFSWPPAPPPVEGQLGKPGGSWIGGMADAGSLFICAVQL